MAHKRPTDEDRVEAIRRLLEGLSRGDEVHDLSRAIEDLHPKNNTFPGEVFTRLAATALDLGGVTPDRPLPYEGLREKFLPECDFRGRQNRKIQYAVLTAAAARGGLEPDLLDEVIWWHEDDFWRYGLAAAVAIIRSCADRTGVPVPEFANKLADRDKITL
ncbi:MAG: hypothetical protein JO265_06635 [Acidimicrobiia bacterium]|nr:hypothetical protein [Acidimicrobiia bacterium]